MYPGGLGVGILSRSEDGDDVDPMSSPYVIEYCHCVKA